MLNANSIQTPESGCPYFHALISKDMKIPELYCYNCEKSEVARKILLFGIYWSVTFRNKMQMDAEVRKYTDCNGIKFTEKMMRFYQKER